MPKFYETVLPIKTASGKYSYKLHKAWAFSSIPHGGYLLSIILTSCQQFVASNYAEEKAYKDPLHITAHYLRRSISDTVVEVVVAPIHVTRTMLLLSASLSYEGSTNITSTVIFGTIPPLPTLPLAPPSPPLPSHSPRFPISIHPSDKEVEGFHCLAWFKHANIIIRDIPKEYLQDSLTIGGEWGGFVELGEPVTILTMPFLVDLFKSFAEILLPNQLKAWYPTVTLSVAFIFPLPPPDLISKYKVALFAHFRTLVEGRGDVTCEVWLVPEREDGDEEDRWRDRAYPVAVGKQLALITPRDKIIKKQRDRQAGAKM